MKKKLFLMLLLAALFVLSASVSAREIEIVNAGFEDPVMADGIYEYVLPGWGSIAMAYGGGWLGIWNPGSPGSGQYNSYGGDAPEGENVAYIAGANGDDGGGFAQVLAETLKADMMYRLEVEVGCNKYYTSGTYRIQLLAGGELTDNGAQFGFEVGELLAEKRRYIPSQEKNVMRPEIVRYTYDPADAALVGENLQIRLLVQNDAGEINFDDVRLFAFQNMNPDPEDGHPGVKPPYGSGATGDEVVLSWTNLDPNAAADPPVTYVQVMLKKPGESEFTMIVDPLNGEGADQESVTINVTENGEYLWQVNSYLYGDPTIVDYSLPAEPNVVIGAVFSFIGTDDLPPDSVEIQFDAATVEDVVTWSGVDVPVTANVIGDDGTSPLAYVYSIRALDSTGDVIAITENGNAGDKSTTDIAVVTITKPAGPRQILIVNAGFEVQVLADGEDEWSLGGEEHGWGSFANEGYHGPWNPTIADFTLEAPEGENVGYTNPYNADPNDGGGFAQVLSETFIANTTYTLTVRVGRDTGNTWNGYAVQLLAGGTQGYAQWPAEIGGTSTLLVEDANSLDYSVTVPPKGTFITSTVEYTTGADAIADPNVGKPIQIRLLIPGKGIVNDEVHTVCFDDVKLTAAGPYNVNTYELTISVTDDNDTAVEDTMTIEVYDDSCSAARIGLSMAAVYPGDLDLDCDIDPDDLRDLAAIWLTDSDLGDFVEIAEAWLVNYDTLTGPVVK